jgi:hypothetical protein
MNAQHNFTKQEFFVLGLVGMEENFLNFTKIKKKLLNQMKV